MRSYRILCHYIPLYLIENEDEIKQAFPDRVTDDEYIFIYDRDMTPNEITLKCGVVRLMTKLNTLRILRQCKI